MAKRKLTANQKAYRKEVNRIKKFISRAEKRGYQFEENIIPKTPKRITKAKIEQLKQLTPNELYKRAVYRTAEGGLLSGVQRRAQERQVSAIKAAQTRRKKKESKQEKEYRTSVSDVIVDNFIEIVNNLLGGSPSEADQMIINFIENMITFSGKEAVADALMKMQKDGVEINIQMRYKGELVQSLLEFLSLNISGQTLPQGAKEKLVKASEEMESYYEE